MRIGLAGTVSVGKTTLALELAKLNQFKDYYVATERSKYLKELGIPLNTDSTVRGQFVFMAERASELIQDNLITDRTIYDVCAFTLSSKSIDWYVKRRMVEAAVSLIEYYDYVVYVSPKGIDIEDNGIRAVDPVYREKIDYTIVNMLEEYKPKNLIKVEGSTQERIDAIISHIYIQNTTPKLLTNE
jgi:GTPase SAR1 family protein